MKIKPAFLSLLLIVSCAFSTKEKLVDNYYLLSTSDKSSAINLSYYIEDYDAFVGVVRSGVSSSKFDEKYIYLKMKPIYDKKYPDGKVEYYIVPICYSCTDYLRLEKYYGPLDYTEFNSTLLTLGIQKHIF